MIAPDAIEFENKQITYHKLRRAVKYMEDVDPVPEKSPKEFLSVTKICFIIHKRRHRKKTVY